MMGKERGEIKMGDGRLVREGKEDSRQIVGKRGEEEKRRLVVRGVGKMMMMG